MRERESNEKDGDDNLAQFFSLIFLRCISATCEQKTKVHPTFLFCICYEPLFLCPTVNIFLHCEANWV